ncbi:hypothetical protein CIL05_13685 [Virgibacillus profundi]|uniref:Uncharacterized protein n=1 Tax=Virgibacillus profundi TaxID=2024555 RepID=A0A2A2ICJ5_9BACI|nr:hypothetical protein [Virgibacillus profundi]PAV29026.1 hypothetical protein CIL05_13685 [Virgibacillus profundi]PXY53195.1 hypothetical protein CIT14_13810 [Virgibacillus profundi]
MEGLFGLFEALASNFFIVIIIIAGIIGFFRDNSAKQKEKQQRKPNNVPRPTATPSGGNKPRQRVYNDNQTDKKVYTTSIEEQQNAQMEQLANRYKTSANRAMNKLPHDAIIGDTLREPDKGELSQSQESLKRQIGSNLNKKGLVNGIIMSEVLGPPRASKPYRSVIGQRRK